MLSTSTIFNRHRYVVSEFARELMELHTMGVAALEDPSGRAMCVLCAALVVNQWVAYFPTARS
jgi:uncharacterized protein (DUF1800 family)